MTNGKRCKEQTLWSPGGFSRSEVAKGTWWEIRWCLVIIHLHHKSHAELSAQINLLVLVYKISSKVLKRSHRDISNSFLALDHYPRGRIPIQVVEANMCNMLYICWIPYFHLLLLVHCKRIITESTPIRKHQILTVIICYGDRNRTKKIKGQRNSDHLLWR